jgi:hypothetical protein
MEDVERFAERLRQFEACAAEEGESLRVVGLTVEVPAREVFRGVNEADRNRIRVVDVDGRTADAEVKGYSQFAFEAFAAGLNLVDIVSWGHDTDLVSHPGKGFRQRPRHIGESTGLCVRDDLRSGEQYIQSGLPQS